MGKVILITAADMSAAATIEAAIKLGLEVIVQRDGEIAAHAATAEALSALELKFKQQTKLLEIATADLASEKDAHQLTKTKSTELIVDLKDQLAVANANIGSEQPIISFKSKKLVVHSTAFHLPKDPTAYTLEDLKKGKPSEELIERILAIKGQGLLSEATK